MHRRDKYYITNPIMSKARKKTKTFEEQLQKLLKPPVLISKNEKQTHINRNDHICVKLFLSIFFESENSENLSEIEFVQHRRCQVVGRSQVILVMVSQYSFCLCNFHLYLYFLCICVFAAYKLQVGRQELGDPCYGSQWRFCLCNARPLRYHEKADLTNLPSFLLQDFEQFLKICLSSTKYLSNVHQLFAQCETVM